MGRRTEHSQSAHRFPTTQWELLQQARSASGAGAKASLSSVCQRYWPPVYCFYRRTGADADRALDLTQAFFAELLAKDWLHQADPTRGKFRSFLLAAARNFLANQRDAARAAKRGGKFAIVSLDWQNAEDSFLLDPGHDETPEALYERKWAAMLLEGAIDHLRREFAGAGRAVVFEALRGHLVGESVVNYSETGLDLGMSESAVRVAVHRLKKRLGDLIEREIAATVERPEDIPGEVEYLISLFAT